MACNAAWRFGRTAKGVMGFALAMNLALADDHDTLTTGQLKKMSLEELMDVQVTLVSRKKERLTQAASSIQVITNDDIRRSGALTLPEALRLASNLQVAQVDASKWAISSRGKNDPSALSNKLLVMIDGRTIYTPLYAGVFWDVQNVMLDNVERIEVISGPGGTLWGANAVNGVINVVTKGAEDNQGGLIGGAVGTQMRDAVGARYAGKAGEDLYFRVWGRRLDRNSVDSASGADAGNGWDFNQAGYRADWLPREGERVSFIGNFYGGKFEQSQPGSTKASGHYEILRWTKDISPVSGFQAQVYFDQALRDIPGTFEEDLRTLDFDFQHRLPLGPRNDLVWGAGYRFMNDRTLTGPSLAFAPADKNLNLFNVFLQDQFQVMPDLLALTLGGKVEHNDYSGFEVMPSGRLAFTPNERNTVWGSVSRAVRSPSRFDVDLFIPAPSAPAGPDPRKLVGGPDFKAEYLTAYELGYRFLPIRNLSAAVVGFYHVYDDLRIIETADGVNFVFGNSAEGDARGIELSAGLQAARWWRLRGGYTYLEEDFWVKPGASAFVQPGLQGNDPRHHLNFQSMMDLPANFQLNVMYRYVSELPTPVVPDYFTFDVMLAWQWRQLEFAVIGKDLAEESHAEFGPAMQEIPRSVTGRASWRF
jgi:iron complex outermembrane recepter protein